VGNGEIRKPGRFRVANCATIASKFCVSKLTASILQTPDLGTLCSHRRLATPAGSYGGSASTLASIGVARVPDVAQKKLPDQPSPDEHRQSVQNIGENGAITGGLRTGQRWHQW